MLDEKRFDELKQLLVLDQAVINEGKPGRIYNFIKRAQAGENLTVAFLGGSITQGARATTNKDCYAYRTYAWLQETFPQAKLTYHNAGIGGTTSHLGVGRVQEEVLSVEPDLVIVEFSVNDEDESAHFKETYEGLVRRILSSKTKPAVLLVHNVRYNDGGNAEAIHKPIGMNYGLPEVSMKSAIYPLIATGQIENREITPDDLHPNDLGHALVSRVICSYFEQVIPVAQKSADPYVELPAPLTKNRYEQANRYRNDALVATENVGFVADDTLQEGIWDCFKKGFKAQNVGDRIIFKGSFSQLAIQYRKTVRKPAPIAMAVIDGDQDNAVLLDSNFTEDWGDCLYLETVREDLDYKEHTVEIRITETTPEDKECFYLVSLITA